MRTASSIKLIAAAVVALAVAASSSVQAQVLRGLGRPILPVPAPGVPPGQQTAPPQQNAAVDPQPTATDAESGRELIRGSQLIGMPIWGPDHQRMGVVRDFIVDWAGGCPSLYFAFVPETSGWNGEYAIVPFGALRMNLERQGGRFFVLDLPLDRLRLAPRLAIDRWNSLRDRRLLNDSRQFFCSTERTAARPDFGATREGDVRREEPRLGAQRVRENIGVRQLEHRNGEQFRPNAEQFHNPNPARTEPQPFRNAEPGAGKVERGERH